MRLLFAQLALALFQIDLAVKHEMDEQPDGQPEQLLPGGVVGLKKLHNHGTAGGKYVGHMPEIIRVSGAVTIVCIGFDQKEALTTVSEEFPDQSFIICDTECAGSNVTSVVFRAEETGFQLGVLAGLLVKEGSLENSRGNNTIGFVGGSDIATINQFAAGYEAGARLANPDVTVLRSYVGSFSDPTTATELATSLYEQGADIVFACAGGSGLGVFTAAEKQNGYALGIETNQNALSPDCIIASGTRAWDEAIYDATQKALDGTLESGLLSYGISDGMLQAERAGKRNGFRLVSLPDVSSCLLF